MTIKETQVLISFKICLCKIGFTMQIVKFQTGYGNKQTN